MPYEAPSVLVTYLRHSYLGDDWQAMELGKPEPYSAQRLALDVAGSLGDEDTANVRDIAVMAEGLDHMKRCETVRSNPFAWTVEYARYEALNYCVSLWSGDTIVSRIFGTRSQCSAISAHWWARIFEAREVFAESRRNIVEALKQDERARQAELDSINPL